MPNDTTPEEAKDKALRLAHALDGGKLIDDSTEWADTLHASAAELRRLHARVQKLERAVAHAEMAAADERKACAAHYLTIMRSALAAQRDEYVRICERIASFKWDAYKGLSEDHPTNPDRGNPHTEGMADGAELCAQAIRDLANTVQPPPLQTKTNQCGETCERAKLCAICARGLEDPADEALTAEQIEALKADSDRLEWLFRPQREEGWMWHNLQRVDLHEHKYFSRASDVRLMTHESFREAIDAARAAKLPPKKPKPTVYFGSGGVALKVEADNTCMFSYYVNGGGMQDKFLYSMIDDGYKPHFDVLLEKHNLRLSDKPVLVGNPPRLTDRVVKKESE